MEISKASVKEKNIHHGHISSLHIWWARRPLASSRATAFAALTLASKNDEDAQRKSEFVIKLSQWENSLNKTLIEEARKAVLADNGGKPPKVLDPFAGGGAIPLEALRLGCDTYASDYNPVATLILRCVLEYPAKFGNARKNTEGLANDSMPNRLLEQIEKWGKSVQAEAKKKIGQFYPPEPDGTIPVGFIWARSVPCQNPSCGSEIPLIRQYWLVRKDDKKVSLYPHIRNKGVGFKIVGNGYDKLPTDFNPDKGTVAEAIVTCLVCGSVIAGNTTRKLFRERKASERMICVILRRPGHSGKLFRIPSPRDVEMVTSAAERLKSLRTELESRWGIDPIPDEAIPSTMPGGINVGSYGFATWGSLFNPRQMLALVTFAEEIRRARDKMLEEGYDAEYARGLLTYLALNFDNFATYLVSLARYRGDTQSIERSFDRQAIQMVWDYGEVNPFGGSRGDWNNMLATMLKAVEHCCRTLDRPGVILSGTATKLPYQSDYFDAVLTDPPYYYNMKYADQSDFFYVWLKRTIGDLYPELFSTPLTPKSEEIIEGAFWDKVRYGNKDKKWFESMLTEAFREIYRVLRLNGIAIIVYTHKSTAGWESLINSLLDSSLIVTATWPINTEMKERLAARGSAALASSIYVVARKTERKTTSFYKEVKDELRAHLARKLDILWNQGISGADFFIAGIGSAIEVFGKYEKIIDDEGNLIRADRLLEDVRRIVIDYAVRQVLHNGFAAEIKPLTRFYVLWRWAYGDVRVPFDEARKLAQSVGIDLAQEWNRGFVRKDKDHIEVLGPDDRELKDLESSPELIDVMHHVLLLWKKGKNEEIVNILKETGFGMSDVFYRVAQAISESLPNGKEKKLLEGFLSGRARIIEDVRKETVQARLFQ
jgi:putative DNA methylase